MERAWILIGMMGAGKTSVGRRLAELSEREFVDTDLLLQNRLGRTISQIFQVYGGPAFRDHETSVLRGLSAGPYVLATGGGIVVRPENFEIMRGIGRVIYLKATLQTLVERLEASKKKRPLLADEEWESRLEELLDIRMPHYQAADVSIEVDGLSVDEVARRVFEAVRA
jgi:shikimate kinase